MPPLLCFFYTTTTTISSASSSSTSFCLAFAFLRSFFLLRFVVSFSRAVFVQFYKLKVQKGQVHEMGRME